LGKKGFSDLRLFRFFGESVFFGNLLQELVHASHGVHQSGLAGIERVARRTSLGFGVFLGRSDGISFPARAFNLRVGIIFGMDVFFHRKINRSFSTIKITHF